MLVGHSPDQHWFLHTIKPDMCIEKYGGNSWPVSWFIAFGLTSELVYWKFVCLRSIETVQGYQISQKDDVRTVQSSMKSTISYPLPKRLTYKVINPQTEVKSP